ncbi:MAG: membrane protein insertion efficiency factor YidD [Candidatus Peregrinibacteria bacterium]|nr:membrane protein insertion efficiency factor YidD [Candidatus Peregrinibacteria bacterium]MDZ4245395.1 membrane protein insertion efficiency factor YidD [Candidatus Gracilibacteria bacterium]
MVKKVLIFIIRIYQKTLSPDHSAWGKALFTGGYCKFTPSCSTYMIGAIEKHGAIKGIFKGIWRVLRCNPFNKGGCDLPGQRKIPPRK